MNKLFEQAIKDISALGSLIFYLFISFFILILGDKQLFLWLIIGLFFSYILIIIIRTFYHKNRPSKQLYSNLIEKIDASSFPSHHSLRVTMLLCLLSFYYKSIYLAILLLTVSILVFYSRYYLKKHYVSDIIFGLLLGIIESIIIILYLN